MEAACKSKPGLFEKHHCSAENFVVLSIDNFNLISDDIATTINEYFLQAKRSE